MNRLASETSPYLLQHASNPVDWYAWGPEALERAREEDRPILLSIGYSACHWCHVMERESFEDPEVAALMNEWFVNVKVDREERPDVDAVYMRAIQALTGRGGWPLTVFLTPACEPYYGGTYYPPEPRHGMPSFRQVLRATHDAWTSRRDMVRQAGAEIRELLERSQGRGEAAAPPTGEPEGDPTIDSGVLEDARRALAARFDADQGGFGPAPKFPQPVTLEFLLRRHRATGSDEALEMVRTTLTRMAHGGIRDHVGGGFHRYSVDRRWLVPHFEKMLYDNALLGRLYVQAWQVTGDPLFREVAQDTFRWLLDDMRSEKGGFFAARDADSEGEEGLFYVWTPGQVVEALGPEEGGLFNRSYDVSEAGNFEGRSIPHLPHPLSAVATREGADPDELRVRLAAARSKLAEVRERRLHPARDEKILAGWNGFAIRGLAEAGGALHEPEYVEAASRAMEWLLDVLRPEGRDGGLQHVWTAGEAKIPAFLDDWAALGNAALTLHEVTLDPRWLEEGRWLVEGLLVRFWEEDEGLFFDTPHDGERLLVRPRDVTDTATPSGTSLATELCLRAGHLFGEPRWDGIARRVLVGHADALARLPAAFGRLLAVAQTSVAPPLELAVIGDPAAPETRALLEVFLERYLPERTIVGSSDGSEPDVPLLEGRTALADDAGAPLPTAYLCEAYACRRPVTDAEALVRQLSER